MPKFVGGHIEGSRTLGVNNARAPAGHVRLTYAQASLLSPAEVLRSLDTTDKGSYMMYAKRWYRWFAHVSAVYACPRSTPSMRARADRALAVEASRRGGVCAAEDVTQAMFGGGT